MDETFTTAVGLRSGRTFTLPYPLERPQLRAFLNRVSTGKDRTITIEWPEHGEAITLDREAIELVQSRRA